MQVGKIETQAVKRPVENISHGGINYEFRRGKKFSICKVWVGGMPYPIEYKQDRAIDGVCVQLSRNSIGNPVGLIITSQFPVPTKWKRKLKVLVEAIHTQFVELGYAKKINDADFAYITDFIFNGNSKSAEEANVAVCWPNKRMKTASELLPDLELTVNDWREIAKVAPFRVYR